MRKRDSNNANGKNNNCKKGKNDEEKGESHQGLVACTEQNQSSKKRKQKQVYEFGNYRGYYGYRIEQGLDEDPRLKAMKREWFEGKDCLDIGCNIGIITIEIAKKFGCKSILGLDIDGDLIWKAKQTLSKSSTNIITSKTRRLADSELVNGLADHAAGPPLVDVALGNSGEPSLLDANNLDKIVSFQEGNFVRNWHAPANKSYHAILCLSMVKWVHLNWGDDGLITLFWKVWTLLEPGGVFILEPQPWKSYYNNRLVSETTSANYKSIHISPEDFQEVLLDKIGFQRVENMTSKLCDTKAGFDRPILAFWK